MYIAELYRPGAIFSAANSTGWAKKLHTELMAITLSILNGFSKFFHCWKAKYISNKTHVVLPTIPSVCCRTTLRKLDV